LQSVDASLEESAQVLGARRWTVIRRINLPLVAPAITGGALLGAVDSLALFGPQAILGTPARIVFLTDPHLRHHRRLSPALGRGGGAVPRACAADRARPGHPARLSRAPLLHLRRRAWRAHRAHEARWLALGASGLLRHGSLLERGGSDLSAGHHLA